MGAGFCLNFSLKYGCSWARIDVGESKSAAVVVVLCAGGGEKSTLRACTRTVSQTTESVSFRLILHVN